MQFDVLITNPPYQSPQIIKNKEGKRGRGDKHLLWPKFIKKSFSIVKDNGYICSINPSKWRKPNDDLWDIMKNKQIEYLEIHNTNDGKKTFKCSTRYDWYVIKNCPQYKNTTIKDQTGLISSININEIFFIPNAKISEINNLIAKDNEEKVNILYSCVYHHTYPTMNRIKTDTNLYPCIYSISVKNEPNCYFSNTNQRGHFGIPKLIFASGGIKSMGIIIDEKGEYGMTEFAKGIVDDISKLSLIKQAILSPKFKEIAEYCSMSANELDKDILKLFKKDFWKKFIENN